MLTSPTVQRMRRPQSYGMVMKLLLLVKNSPWDSGTPLGIFTSVATATDFAWSDWDRAGGRATYQSYEFELDKGIDSRTPPVNIKAGGRYGEEYLR